ncbi:MAG: ABC transporter permease [Gorillibacterium sp.]|nr:ABC transporter permease [Gorillibacterium sp.]
MLNLIRNENMKIYNRVRTWVLLGILVTLTIALPILISTSMNTEGDWRQQVQAEVDQFKPQLNTGMEVMKKTAERIVKIGEYRLAHDIPPADGSTWGNVMNVAPFLILIVGVFTVIVAADIVAGEFSTGTIKLLLIRPASRTKILLSKYIATLLFSLLLFATQFIVSYLVNGIISSFAGSNSPYLFLGGDGLVHERSMLVHALSSQGLNCIGMLMIVTMAFMISSAFRSSALSIALSLIFFLAGTVPAMLLRKYTWMKYYLFNNTDLTVYAEGIPPYEGMTLNFSIAVLVGYFLLFHLLSWFFFVKRDVAA